ncbi:uncharacterized [Tachysurus ichikawai]
MYSCNCTIQGHHETTEDPGESVFTVDLNLKITNQRSTAPAGSPIWSDVSADCYVSTSSLSHFLQVASWTFVNIPSLPAYLHGRRAHKVLGSLKCLSVPAITHCE